MPERGLQRRRQEHVGEEIGEGGDEAADCGHRVGDESQKHFTPFFDSYFNACRFQLLCDV